MLFIVTKQQQQKKTWRRTEKKNPELVSGSKSDWGSVVADRRPTVSPPVSAEPPLGRGAVIGRR